MALPLALAGDTAADAPAKAWAVFEARRESLVAQMEMATCDGCDGCGLRCMAGFGVTRDEWQAADTYLSTLPRARVQHVLGQKKTVPWPGAEDTGATVTFCRFRDMETGNCFVYPARATVCRLFGHTEWLPCPIEAVKTVPGGAPAVWNEYRTFTRKTWEEWDALRGEEQDQEKKRKNV